MLTVTIVYYSSCPILLLVIVNLLLCLIDRLNFVTACANRTRHSVGSSIQWGPWSSPLETKRGTAVLDKVEGSKNKQGGARKGKEAEWKKQQANSSFRLLTVTFTLSDGIAARVWVVVEILFLIPDVLVPLSLLGDSVFLFLFFFSIS